MTRRALLGVTLAAALLVGLGAVVVRLVTDRFLLREACVATVGGAQARIGIEEAEQASTIAAAAVRRGLSVRATTTALATSLQQHEPEARALATALMGRSPAAFTCRVRPDSPGRETPGRRGLTPRAAGVLNAVETAFGTQRAGGFDPAGVTTGHIRGSAHYSGRAVDLFHRPVTAVNRRAGWASAQWLVANAERLDVATVIYDGKIWTARRSVQGWREYTPPNGNTANPTLMHRDHVHLDVR